MRATSHRPNSWIAMLGLCGVSLSRWAKQPKRRSALQLQPRLRPRNVRDRHSGRRADHHRANRPASPSHGGHESEARRGIGDEPAGSIKSRSSNCSSDSGNSRPQAGNRGAEAGVGSREADGPAKPSEVTESTNMDSPVPDYTEGSSTLTHPRQENPASVTRSKRAPLVGSFGPGFRFQTEDEKFGSKSITSRKSRLASGNKATRTRPTAASSCLVNESSSTATSPNPLNTNSRSIEASTTSIFLTLTPNLHLNDKFHFRIGRFFTPLPTTSSRSRTTGCSPRAARFTPPTSA